MAEVLCFNTVLGSKSVIVTGDQICPRPVAVNKSYPRRINKEARK